MNYFDYLCGVYEICFRAPARLNATDGQKKSDQPKFYDYSEKPISESFVGATTLNILASNTKPTSNEATETKTTGKFTNSDWDIIPKTCAGDWVLRYTQNETNFNPWHFDTKFSRFELVPWRQQNKRIDLVNAIGWEPFNSTAANQQQIRALQKFESAQIKRLRKQRLKRQREKFRSQIKIRFILSLEVRQKKLKMHRRQRANTSITTTSYQRKLVLQRDRQMIVFNENAYDLSEHWGYFSQRNKGVEEMLVSNASQLNMARRRKAIAYHRSSSSTSSNRSKSNKSAGDIVPCPKCQNRCVMLCIIL